MSINRKYWQRGSALKHKTIKPKKGVHPTMVVELCPACDAAITKIHDPNTDITTRRCIQCGWTNIRANRALLPSFFQKAGDLK
jgi:ferredoxin-like protein FixX